MKATAYGFETPRGAHWSERARCSRADVDPEWFWPASATAVAVKRALSVCDRCHVVEQCYDDAAATPARDLRIAGGRLWWPRPARR